MLPSDAVTQKEAKVGRGDANVAPAVPRQQLQPKPACRTSGRHKEPLGGTGSPQPFPLSLKCRALKRATGKVEQESGWLALGPFRAIAVTHPTPTPPVPPDQRGRGGVPPAFTGPSSWLASLGELREQGRARGRVANGLALPRQQAWPGPFQGRPESWRERWRQPRPEASPLTLAAKLGPIPPSFTYHKLAAAKGTKPACLSPAPPPPRSVVHSFRLER